MTTNELLACVTPGANDYIQTTINTKNKADYQKLKKLFDEQQFEAKSFEDSDLDILTFDWQGLERDRNWWWQLQALPFLNWYANSLALQSEEERTRYLLLCLDAIHNWINHAKQNKESPLVWHDHAAAFRVRNLTNWLVFCHSSDLPLGEEPRAELLGSLIIEHLDWLQEDKHYSKHTNHGFDQAMIALTIALMFARNDFEAYRLRNRERLEDEVTFAFTDEGVHKENSPGYQKMMLGRLKQLRTLAPLGEQLVSQIGERYIEKAEAFLRAITLPNGYLPMIGDTRGEDKGLPYEQKEQVDVLDYSASGYVIVRGEVLGKDFHLVFKASHISHYHRHDDDLSIHLYHNGKNLLGDGGLGSHNEKDKKRKALRSYLSHNAPYLVDGKAARKVGELDGALPTVSLQDEKIVGKSFCYGAELTREIDISRLQDGKLIIRDSVDESSGQPFAINFFSSGGLYEDGECLLVSVNGNKALRISATSPVDVKSKSAYISKEFSKFSGAAAVTISHGDKGENAIEFEVDINHPKQVLHEVMYRGFGPIQLLEAGDWFFDDDYPGNVCHHIMSLRWIGEVKSPSIRARILRSFIAYHGSHEKPHSRYYLGRTADHTTSIRLAELLAAMKDKKTDANLKSLLRRELAKNIRSCLKDTYKENNNHGLMVDKAILLCLIKDKWLLEEFGSDVSFVISRVEKQQNGIFDQEGYCKEHSTSYQEYNLGIALDLLDVMESGRGLGFDTHIDELKSRVEKIKVASRKALGFLLKDDGTYVTVGDSFPQPKPDILEKAFGSRDPKTALLPESEQHGVFYNKTLGIYVYRGEKLHAILNASWHSYVHKQNDDLAFQLRFSGVDLILDGGYSDIVCSQEVIYKSEELHSTIIPRNVSWLSVSKPQLGFSRVTPGLLASNKYADKTLTGEHTRAGGVPLGRSVRIISDRELEVSDAVPEDVFARHRFMVPLGSVIQYDDKIAVVLVDGIQMKFQVKNKLGSFGVSSLKCIKANQPCLVTALDYSCFGNLKMEISLSESVEGEECSNEKLLKEVDVGKGRYTLSQIRLDSGGDLIFLDDSRGRSIEKKLLLCASNVEKLRRKRLLCSFDNGQKWSEIYRVNDDSSEVIARGFLASRFIVLQTENPVSTKIIDYQGRVLKESYVGEFLWHGTQSVGESRSGVIMYSEYQTGYEKFMPELKVWKLDPNTLNWRPVLSKVAGAYPRGEIRHFHTCMPDPYFPGRWYASSGDNKKHNKIWVSEDDGESWIELAIVLNNKEVYGIEDYYRAARFTSSIFCYNGTLLWPTDDDLDIGHAAMVVMKRRGNTAELSIQALLLDNFARSIIAYPGKNIVITESKSNLEYVDLFSVSDIGEVSGEVRLRNRTRKTSSVTLSIASSEFVNGSAFFSSLGALGEAKATLVKLQHVGDI